MFSSLFLNCSVSCKALSLQGSYNISLTSLQNNFFLNKFFLYNNSCKWVQPPFVILQTIGTWKVHIISVETNARLSWDLTRDLHLMTLSYRRVFRGLSSDLHTLLQVWHNCSSAPTLCESLILIVYKQPNINKFTEKVEFYYILHAT